MRRSRDESTMFKASGRNVKPNIADNMCVIKNLVAQALEEKKAYKLRGYLSTKTTPNTFLFLLLETLEFDYSICTCGTKKKHPGLCCYEDMGSFKVKLLCNEDYRYMSF